MLLGRNQYWRIYQIMFDLIQYLLMLLLMRTRPDLPRGKGTFDWWRSRCWWSDFKSARFKPYNRYTTALLVINQAQLDWPRQEGFSCKRIEEHKQEDVNNAIWYCKYGSSELKRGSRTRFQRTNWHNGGDQERAPESMYKDLSPQIQWWCLCSSK